MANRWVKFGKKIRFLTHSAELKHYSLASGPLASEKNGLGLRHAVHGVRRRPLARPSPTPAVGGDAACRGQRPRRASSSATPHPRPARADGGVYADVVQGESRGGVGGQEARVWGGGGDKTDKTSHIFLQVALCPHEATLAHDWALCPYAHTGTLARQGGVKRGPKRQVGASRMVPKRYHPVFTAPPLPPQAKRSPGATRSPASTPVSPAAKPR